ncbi:MAG: 3'(2'), 5'-bisphosphate nucleotidase, partial [Candidatus Endobugula sp.]
AVTLKSDQSPVTAADIAAHQVLQAGLQSLLANVPVLSEEADIPCFEERQHWQRYWLVDPLDGTKEFIRRNGEFTVNVALIEKGRPVLGVVTVPVTGEVYWGVSGLGAFKQGLTDSSGLPVKQMTVRKMAPRLEQGLPVEVLASRRHGDQAMAVLLSQLHQQFTHIACQAMGSSLKLCLLADARADLYPRLAPTSEWDTAAAQAIVEAAGGSVVDMNFLPLKYNTKASLLNPHFYVIADTDYPWQSLLS